MHRLHFDRSSSRYEATLCLSREDAASLEASASRFLHDRERDRFAAFPAPRRRSFARGRYCAKGALDALVRLERPTHVCVDAGVFGQPVVSDIANTKVSISHTCGLGAAVAFPEAHPVGVDVEAVPPASPDAIQHALTADENEHRRALSPSDDVSCVVMWTLKEVLAKLLQCGFTTPLPILEVEEVEVVSDAYGRTWWRATYTNFAQYKGLACRWNSWILAIGCPRNSTCSFDRPLGLMP